jgi:hypothetical protein
MRGLFTTGILIVLAIAPLTAQGGTTLLTVDDGNFFYDVNNDCVGDTDAAAGARALRHWHFGFPYPAAEPVGGFGCLGGPKTWTVSSASPIELSGSIRYTWDTNVPGGGFNDVHLHAYNAAGALVWSTLQTEGPKPVVPMVLQVRSHAISATLPAGTYTLVEDVFSGEHSAWLTKLTVTSG